MKEEIEIHNHYHSHNPSLFTLIKFPDGKVLTMSSFSSQVL